MNKQGYTLLEVILFLSISSALVLIIFVGLTPRLRNVRFTESVRSLESNIVRNFSDRANGVNKRTSVADCAPHPSASSALSINPSGTHGPGEAGTCVVNGTAAIFGYGGNQDRVLYRTIVSLRRPRASCSGAPGSIDYVLRCHNATIITTDSSEYIYANGLTQSTDHTAFAYLIDPDSASSYRLQLTDNSASGYSGLIDSPSITRESNPSLDICFSIEPRHATLTFTNTRLTPTTIFNEECV